MLVRRDADPSGYVLRLIEVDLNRLLDASRVQTKTGLVAMRLYHELQRVPKVSPALIQRFAVSDGAGNFFDPTHKPSARRRLDDCVVSLLHARHGGLCIAARQGF